MINKYEYNDDIIMRDDTSHVYPSYFSFSNYFRPGKRKYNDMLSQTNQDLINKRIDSYKLCEQASKSNSILNTVNNNNIKTNKLIVMNYNDFNCINNAKKNLLGKKIFAFDEEKERKLVENYYKIKNAQLNKLRFGTN